MKTIDTERFILGESPIWHPIRQCFYWVDIVSGRVFSLDNNQAIPTITLNDKVGCIVPTSDGHLLAALSRSLVKINLDTKQAMPLTDHLISETEMFNDGNVDSLGRFWVASKDVYEQTGRGHLYCFNGQTLSLKERDLIVGNGIDWSEDNNTMYLCDSPRQRIYKYDFDVNTATLSHRRVFKQVETGYPDGLTVSGDDKVLSAHWAGRQISIYDKAANLIDTLIFDAQNVTSLAIGGNDMKTMLVTSASRDVMSNQLQDDGHCFLLPSAYRVKVQHCFKAIMAP